MKYCRKGCDVFGDGHVQFSKVNVTTKSGIFSRSKKEHDGRRWMTQCCKQPTNLDQFAVVVALHIFCKLIMYPDAKHPKWSKYD